MAKSKALSPEVQGLLEKVRLQAQQYSDAFDYFEKKKTEFDKLLIVLEQKNREFSDFLLQIKREILKIKDDFNSTSQSNLKEIKFELKKYSDFDNNYQNLKKFIEELKIFQKEINKTVNHYENNLELFKSDLGFDVDNSINTLRQEFELEIKKNISIIERDISKRFSFADKMIANIKNQIIQDEKKIDIEFGMMKNLIEKMKNENSELSSLVQKNVRKEEKQLNLIEKNIQEEIFNINKRISEALSILKFIDNAGETTEGAVDFDFSKILSKYFQPKNKIEAQLQDIEFNFENKLATINEDLNDLNNRFKKNKNMMIAFLSFGFFFVIALIIILVSYVF